MARGFLKSPKSPPQNARQCVFPPAEAEKTQNTLSSKKTQSTEPFIAEAEESQNNPRDLSGNCLKLKGAPGKKLKVYQELDIRGEAGDNYVVGGWRRQRA